MNWYFKVLKKYAAFKGRASPKEFWYFLLFDTIIRIIIKIIEHVTGSVIAEVHMGWGGIIYTGAVLIPFIAVSVRRLHDADYSGWWSLTILIPYIGGLLLLGFMMKDSKPGENQYGSNPKEEQKHIRLKGASADGVSPAEELCVISAESEMISEDISRV